MIAVIDATLSLPLPHTWHTDARSHVLITSMMMLTSIMMVIQVACFLFVMTIRIERAMIFLKEDNDESNILIFAGTQEPTIMANNNRWILPVPRN